MDYVSKVLLAETLAKTRAEFLKNSYCPKEDLEILSKTLIDDKELARREQAKYDQIATDKFIANINIPENTILDTKNDNSN